MFPLHSGSGVISWGSIQSGSISAGGGSGDMVNIPPMYLCGSITSGWIHTPRPPFRILPNWIVDAERTMSKIEFQIIRDLAQTDDPNTRAEYVDFLIDLDRNESAELVRRGYIPGADVFGRPLECKK